MRAKLKKSRLFPILLPLLLLLILIGLLPTLASTEWGSQKVLTWLGEKKKIDLSARSLSLSWFGPQIAEGLVMRDPPKGLTIKADDMRCSSSLFRLLFSGPKCADLEAMGAAIELQLPEMEPVHFENINLKLRWPSDLLLSGESATGRFDVKIVQATSELVAEAHLQEFPIYAIDRLLSLYMPHSEGLLLALVGPTVDLDLNLQEQLLTLNARSDHFTADLHTKLQNSVLVLESPAEMRFQVTPQLLELLKMPLSLKEPIPVMLLFTDLQFPLERARGRLSVQSLNFTNPQLSALLGNQLQADFTYSAPNLTLSLQTPTLELPESHFLVGNELRLVQPTQLFFNPSPPLQFHWGALPDSLRLSVDELTLPELSAKGRAEISQLLISGLPVRNAQVAFDIKNIHNFTLDLKSAALTASAKGDLTKEVTLMAAAQSMDFGGAGTLHDLNLKAEYDFRDESLKTKFSAKSIASQTPGHLLLDFEKKDQRLEGRLELEKFSSSFLDLFLPGYHLRAYLGPLTSAHAKFGFNNRCGPFSLRLNATNARFSASGQLDNGVIHPKETIYAQLQLTEELTQLLLEEVNPLSVPTFTSQDPLTLEIPHDGVSIPLFPFDPSGLDVPKARIELGQIVCANVGNIHYTLGLLKHETANDPDLHLWFAPLDLSINNGLVNIERTEILIDRSLEICSWGTINLPNDTVDMVLGIPGPTLKKAIGIRDLPANYVLQLPMRGSLDNVKIDTRKATAKITALMIWQKATMAGALGGGIPGAIAGELFGKIAKLPDSDRKAPPAKHPFPWEQGRLKSEKPKEKAVKFKSEEEDQTLPLLKFIAP